MNRVDRYFATLDAADLAEVSLPPRCELLPEQEVPTMNYEVKFPTRLGLIILDLTVISSRKMLACKKLYADGWQRMVDGPVALAFRMKDHRLANSEMTAEDFDEELVREVRESIRAYQDELASFSARRGEDSFRETKPTLDAAQHRYWNAIWSLGVDAVVVDGKRYAGYSRAAVLDLDKTHQEADSIEA